MMVLVLEETAFQILFSLLNSAESSRKYRSLKLGKNFAVSIFSASILLFYL